MSIKISACTIAKNEALNIGKSIESYKDYVDEIIIVDTGSIDETAEIAEKLGAKVLKFEWKNDFSAAKNYAIDNATGDWILFLDADEWFEADTAKNLKGVIEHTINSNYNSAACKLVNFSTETEIMETGTTIRIFKKADNIRFIRPIHEVLADINTNIALPGLFSDKLVINHSGYMTSILEKKAKRNKMLLDKNYALGKFSPIDYFYGIRENLKEDVNLAEHFYKLIENMPDYTNQVSSFNIGNSVDENKLKVVNTFPEKYSFDYRLKLLEEVQKKNPDNPTFKFYEYMMFEKVDKKRAIKALYDALNYEKDFETNNPSKANPFYTKKSEVNSLLGEYEILINDNIKALDHFTEAIKTDYTNVSALKGILSVISNEKTNDIVHFLNSIYDVNNKDVLKFLIDKLRLTKFKEVFLYYFVDYYKKFNEVDLSFFTSRMITGNFEEIIDTYIGVYKESKDEKALLLISAAIICGNSKEKFMEFSTNLTSSYSKILSSYFNGEEIENFSESDFSALVAIFNEIAYIADFNLLKKLTDVYKPAKERFYFEIIKHYYDDYSYNEVLNWISHMKDNGFLKNDLETFANFLMANIFFRTNEYEKLSDCLDKLVSGGFLEQDVLILLETLEADDERLAEYYELIDALSFMRQNFKFDGIKDIVSDSVKFMTIEKLKDDIKDTSVGLLKEQLIQFFEFAEFAKSKEAFIVAEKYYKICLKHKFNVDRCYFSLGEIYNKFEKPELSFYCYENAFCENLVFARNILPKGHLNYNYVFSKKEEKNVEKCPVCGEKSKMIATYINLDDQNLTYNDSMIVGYRCCEKCDHIFAGNDIKDKIFWEKDNLIKYDKNRITLAYDILENLCEMSDEEDILELDSDNGEFGAAAKNYGFNVEHEINNKKFGIIMAGDLLDSTYMVEEKLSNCIECLASDGIIVFEVYDKENAFSKFAPIPLWVKAGVKNVFSRKSLEILFEKLGLHILQIDVDKINEGKIIVFLSKE